MTLRERAVRPWLRLAERLGEQGIGAYRAGELSRARRLLGSRVRMRPPERMAWLYLARAERDAGEPERSLATINGALERFPGWPPAVRHAVELELQLGWPGAVAGHLDSGFDPGDLSEKDLRSLRGLALEHAPEAALPLSEEIARRRPDDPESEVLLDEARGYRAESEEALAIAERLAGSGGAAAIAAAIGINARHGRLERMVELAAELRPAAPEQALSVSALLSRAGFLGEALAVLGPEEHEPALSKRRARIEAQLEVLKGVRPRVPPAGAERVGGRVLHLAHASLPHQLSGYAVRTHRTAIAQGRAGLDPHVVTRLGFAAEGSAGQLERIDGVPYHRIGGSDAGLMPSDERLQAHADAVAGLVAELGPELLHAHSDFQNALVALSLRDAFGIPVVYEVRGFWEETWLARQASEYAARSDAYRLRRQTNLRCMHEADRVVTLSETMKAHIAGQGVDPDSISVVPNAIDAEELEPLARDPGLAGALGIGPGELVVGYIGTLLDYEGLDSLIEVVARLSEKGLPVRCLIVGDGPERARLAQIAARRGAGDRVILTGPVAPDQVSSYYSLLHLFAMPRRPVPVCNLVTPLKPYEAMATGTALLVTDLPPLSEIVGHERTGLVCRAGDTDSLEQALERALGDEELRARVAGAALEWVRAERTWARNAELYSEIYGRIT